MIPNSAFVTIGESAKNMADVASGKAPAAEYAALRNGHFSSVLAITESSIDPGTFSGIARFAVSAYFKTWQRENVYLGEEFPGIQYLATHAVARTRKRIVMLVHNVASLRRRLPLATLRLARFADHLLCLSERSADELRSSYRFPSSRITVIGSRVDTEFFKPDPGEPVLRQVCSAGAVNRDYQTLIDAVGPLAVPTKIAADTVWKHSTGQMVIENLPRDVEMRSWGNYVNLRQLYASSAVCVVPLQRPILSGVTVALEAMAMGRPVILSHNPYVEEFLKDGEHGYLVPPGDAGALREKIRYLVDNPDVANRMGARAREWVVERFTVARYVERILSPW